MNDHDLPVGGKGTCYGEIGELTTSVTPGSIKKKIYKVYIACHHYM